MTLQLSFDIGHSSIGWAVLETRIDKDPNLLGTGVVTFPSSDCAALNRRNKRRLRRNTRSRKQRIERMETLLDGISAIPPEVLKKQHAQGKGNAKKEGGGFAYPWLHAARILAAPASERDKHLLTWPQLWDVLRWYAHNRGYDGNLRWSGDYRCDGLCEENTLSAQGFCSEAPATSPEDDDAEEDETDKLEMGKRVMTDYGFATPTFAETVAKFLLGPARIVKPPKQPGQAGQLVETKETFSREEFHRLLFGLDEAYKEHPKHLRNYFKGLQVAFPRRHFKKDTLLLSGGTEWEVRMILRAHRNAPAGKAQCSEEIETALCGGMPEQPNDWEKLKSSYPKLYLSEAEEAEINTLWGKRSDSKELIQTKDAARKALRRGKLVLPRRYVGGVLFGQLVPRFDNRIIASCPITYARKLPMLLRVIDGKKPYEQEETWSVADRAQLDREFDHFNRKLADARKRGHDLRKLAESYAADLSKVPSKASPEFLDFRWAMLLANVKVRDSASRGPKKTMRPLTADERRKLDEKMRVRGFLVYKRAEGKVPEMNELANIVRDELGFSIEETNLDAFFIPPDMREALKLVPLADGVTAGAAFQLVWKNLTDKLRRRFTIQLLRGEKNNERKLSISKIIQQLERLGGYEAKLKEIEVDLRKAATPERGAMSEKTYAKLLHEEFHAKRLEGRARFHSIVLHQVVAEVMRGEDPRKYAKREGMTAEKLAKAEEKECDGCLVISEPMLRLLDVRPLAEKTNNHLVRHRILVLTGDPKDKPDRMRGLLDDIEEEFVKPNGARIDRITIEVARDLQEMSGKDSEGKKEAEDKKHEEHDALVQKLTGMFKDQKIDGKPVELTAGIIKKARIADDLLTNKSAKNWICPYTGMHLDPVWLLVPENDTNRLEKDHIIPDSQSHSHAIEAQVITFRKVNQMKKNMTSLAFIKRHGGDVVPGLERKCGGSVQILREPQYRAFVEDLPTKAPTKGDSKRKAQRKALLLTEHWSGEDFTPGDLSKTAYIIKLAAEQLRAKYCGLPEAERPQIIYIPGGVTHGFRDKEWKLLHLLGGMQEDVKAEMDKGKLRFLLRYSGKDRKEQAATRKKFYEMGGQVKAFLGKYEKVAHSPAERDERTEELKELLYDSDFSELAEAFYFVPTSQNLKQAIRGITHLHHAVDAIAIGLVSDLCVPKGHTGIHDTIARGVVFNKHKADERQVFEALRHQLGIRKFYRWAAERCDDAANARPGQGGLLCLTPLSPTLRDQIQVRLAEARFNRVVQYHRRSVHGAELEENIWGVVSESEGKVLLRQQKRQNDGSIKLKSGAEVPGKLAGLNPESGSGKLKAVKGVLIIKENYGMALYPKRPATEGEPYEIIPFFRVREQIGKLPKDHRGKRPEILSKGQLIRLTKGNLAGRIWKVISIEANGRIKFFEPDRARKIDAPENFEKKQITTMMREGLELVPSTLCGVASHSA